MASPDFAWSRQRPGPNPIPYSKLNCRALINFLANKSTRHYGGLHNIYLKRLAQRRASRLLISLKQYYIENGRWPEDLDEIASLVPAEAFIDPLNNDFFVYKTTEDTFTLYSKGKNNIDENGLHLRNVGLDDLLFWPPEGCESKR